MQIFLKKYSTSATIDFDLYDVNGSNILTSAAISPSACTLSLDGGPSVLATNQIVVGSNGFSINFTASELTAKRLKFKIVDDNPTKTWLDSSFIVETYGTSASEHGSIASGLFDNVIDGISFRDLLIEAIAQLTGEFIRSGDAFQYLRRDGSTQSHVLSAAYGARVRV